METRAEAHGSVGIPVAVSIYRHALVTRLTHWINVLCVTVLLFSGLQIFNAHPALYWGHFGADADHPVFEIGADEPENGPPVGFARIGSTTFATTGVLGVSNNAAGEAVERGFPRWLTLPGWRELSLGRRWHFFFAWLFVANLLVYFAAGLGNGHLRRDLLPSGQELRPRSLLRDIAGHIKLKFPRGEEARRYNPLQKLAYLAVIGVLLPVMVLTGLTMSPGMDAILPWLVDLFGGRQSARTIHFIAAFLIVLFVVVHVAMVFLAGPINELRSMITGRFRISVEDQHE
ncbi:cytochrome b/b6 domain-containing protein [Methylocapsa palsarum]|uniref:Thiosulfate reductase cytochrome b subunit n=1 Tax=Methylocapsa palsarum TaxID=1612308 RepID=A0A1I4BCK3_9HYPH|nr:cytochrome b/b6 domain-containing protein [Methylocapsa palsarum]SFK65736.1 Thiosulfate reductase cytochrome b subunit [Methylocapsa palsarum]